GLEVPHAPGCLLAGERPAPRRAAHGARTEARARALRGGESARPVRPHRRHALPRGRRDGPQGRHAPLQPPRPPLRPPLAAPAHRADGRSGRGFSSPGPGQLAWTDRPAEAGPRIESEVKRVLKARHDGEEDFTVTTQQAMLDVFGNVMGMITMAVGAIAGIS